MDFIEEYWWIFLFPLIAIGMFLHFRRERERTRVMGLAAARLNLVFQKEDPLLLFRECSLLTKLSGRIRNVSKGEVGGCEMVLLDYNYTVGFGESTTSVTQTVSAVRVAGLKLPAFLLEAKRARWTDMKFDSHPRFSKKYRLNGAGADWPAIRQLFGSYILEFFQQSSRGVSVECDGQWMVIRHSEVGVNRFATAEDIKRLSGGKPDADFAVNFQEALMRKYFEETMQIVDVFRHST